MNLDEKTLDSVIDLMVKEELQDLARRFDAIPADDIESRLPVAMDIEKCLGDRRDEFDRLYTELVEASPAHDGPATAVLRSMGLCL